MVFKDRLKQLRKSKNYTQIYVARCIGVKYQSYQNYERGISFPTLENFIKLADLFEVSLDYLADRQKY